MTEKGEMCPEIYEKYYISSYVIRSALRIDIIAFPEDIYMEITTRNDLKIKCCQAVLVCMMRNVFAVLEIESRV